MMITTLLLWLFIGALISTILELALIAILDIEYMAIVIPLHIITGLLWSGTFLTFIAYLISLLLELK